MTEYERRSLHLQLLIASGIQHLLQSSNLQLASTPQGSLAEERTRHIKASGDWAQQLLDATHMAIAAMKE